MQASLRSRASISALFLVVAGVLSCSDPAPPVPTLESLALSLDSIAIQVRDSSSELTASPRGALGVELEADVTWRSKNAQIVGIVPTGKTVRLVPVKPGATEIEAVAEHLVATAKVVVLDTVFSVAISAPDTIVTMGRSLQFTATVTGPPGASQQIVWTIGNSAVARIDSTQGKNPVLIVSLDTGATTVTATSASDRNKFSLARFRTAGPAELYFESQPGESTVPIRANDILIPGPVVKVRDVLGNLYPGTLGITLTVAAGTGTPGATLLGTPYLTYAAGEARFDNVGVDSSGTGFRLTANAAGLTGTSAPFTVGPECPGVPYSIGTIVTGTITTNSCQSSADVFYNRYIVSATSTSLISGLTGGISQVATNIRWGVVFTDGTRSGALTDTVPHIVAAGKYSVRVYSGAGGQMGTYELRTRFAFLPPGQLNSPSCWRVQAQVGIVFEEELRCLDQSYACGAGRTQGSPFRLWLNPNARATVTASSSAIDPCLEVVETDGSNRYVDDNSGGGTTAQIVIPPAPVARNVFLYVTGRQPVPASRPFTIRITP